MLQLPRFRPIIAQLFVMGGTCANLLVGKGSLSGHRARHRALAPPPIAALSTSQR